MYPLLTNANTNSLLALRYMPYNTPLHLFYAYIDFLQQA